MPSSSETFNYPPKNIVMLTDEATSRSQYPTKRNILAGMDWLLRGAKQHDSLFFHCMFDAPPPVMHFVLKELI